MLAKATDSASTVGAALEQIETPAPLDFFRNEVIHPDNQSLIESEQHRFRLLTWRERWKLQRYTGQLARQLRRGGYNRLIMHLDSLRVEVRQAKEAYATAESDDARRAARARIHAIIQRARHVYKALNDMKPLAVQYAHYCDWLEYEAQHRNELKAEAKRDKQIRADMRKEADWLEQLLLDVFRKTQGCHHIYSDGGKEKTVAPKFERSVTTPDAHYFYLAASKRTLFGWRWKLPYGVTITRLTDDDVIANMHAATKRQVDAQWSDTGQLMFRVSRLDSPDALPKEVKWRDAMRLFPDDKREKFPYTIGVNEGRKFQWFDLLGDPHILVAGKSQSGKSNLVNGMIATLASTHSPEELRIVMVDQKGGLEFTHWTELPHLLWDMVKTVDEVQPVLDRLVAVMKSRMARLEKVKAKDIASFNARVDQEDRLARVLVVIDEMNTFVGLGSTTEDIHNKIMLLVSQGRAVGIHVIASTQHPEVKVIPGRIKTNMSMRLSGAMPTISASQIVLDSPDAARIPNVPGRFVAVVGLQTLQVQVPRIFDEDIAGVVSSTRQEYPDVAENLSDMGELKPLVIWDEQRVLVSCLEWFDGQVSYKKLHTTLGSESPGERELSRICRRLVDQVEALGFVTHEATGERWKIKRRAKAYYLVPLDGNKTDSGDENSVPGVEGATSLAASSGD
jgi:hypothetical protein